MADWIATLKGDGISKGWRLPDGFVAQAETVEGIRDQLGRDLAVFSVGGAMRMVPCAVVAPVVDGEIAPLGQANPPDETGEAVIAAAGVVACKPGWDGVVCVTGARSCWMHLSAGEVVSFQSFASGRIATAMAVDAGPEAHFDAALAEVLARPERLAAGLARPDLDQARMWGCLIGAEIAAAKPYWLGQEVVVVGEMAKLYAKALKMQGVSVDVLDEQKIYVAGFTAIKDAS